MINKFTKFTSVVALMLVAIILAGCVNTTSPVNPMRITWDEAAEIMIDGVIILDVRTLGEFNAGSITNAILLPYDEIKYAAPYVIPDKEQTILLFCRSGRRSAIAANILADMGYQNVFDLGGIIDLENGEF